MTPRALLALPFLLAGMGCAHTVELYSEPPGAKVFVDGEPVGRTPLVVPETTGELDVTPVKMRHESVAARFGLPKDRWATEPLLAGLIAAGNFGRKSPDAVEVNFAIGEIHVRSKGEVEPLYGVPPGYLPLSPPDGEEPLQ